MPITSAEARDTTRAFVREYPGAVHLAFHFRDDVVSLYGSQSRGVPSTIKGGYLPKPTQHQGRTYRGRVDVPLNNIASVSDLVLTLRHEVLGHYGLNTFSAAEKRVLLDGLSTARGEPSLKALWADVDRRYAGRSIDVRAEEVFCLYCEGVDSRGPAFASQAAHGARSLAETCVARTRPMTADDLQAIACMVARGLQDRTRTQQNFPQYDTQFRKEDDVDKLQAPKKAFHELVAEQLIEQLKAGTAPWQQPWEAGDRALMLPMNPTTGARYKGINAIHLLAQGRGDARWMTFKQATALGAQVRKGEKGTRVQYWKFNEDQDKLDGNGLPQRDAQGQPVKETVALERPRMLFACVFNAEQIDGLPALAPPKPPDWQAVDRAEALLVASGVQITHVPGDRAYYRPSVDGITLPEKSQFASADRYYATALHELGHWTGHESRLARDLGHPFGSQGYAKEELRAEIASMMLGAELSLGHDPGQHVAYVGSWIQALQEDPLEIFRAAADAEKIHEYVLGIEQRHLQVQAHGRSPHGDLAVTEGPVNEPHTLEDIAMASHGSRSQAPKDHGSIDQWVLDRLEDGSLEEGLEDASLAQVERVAGALERMYPVRANAAYWSRRDLPVDAAAVDDKIAIAWDRLQQETRPDTVLAEAMKRLQRGGVAPWDKEVQAFEAASRRAFGATLPADWTGHVRIVEGTQAERLDGSGLARDGEVAGPPSAKVQVRRGSVPAGEAWVTFRHETHLSAAHRTLDRLVRVDALAQDDEREKASRLARWREDRVRRDPHSRIEDVSAAKQARLTADAAAWAARRIEQQQTLPSGNASPSRSQEGRAAASADRTYLAVPFEDKELAKGLGARWDRTHQSWFVPEGVDAAPFARWSSPDKAAPGLSPAAEEGNVERREYLAVPFDARQAAKAAGARWDRVARSWYVGPQADMVGLAPWRLDASAAHQAPAMAPREEFAAAMKEIGLVVQGEHPVMDGQRHRVAVEGGKKGALDGFYVGHLDGHPAGRIINNKTGADVKWRSKGYALSAQDRARWAAEAADKLARRAEALRQTQEASAERVGRQMAELRPIEQRTPYLVAKGIRAHVGAMTDADGLLTHVPAYDAAGKLWTVQYIQPDGTKRFAKDSRKEGCFHAVGGQDALARVPRLVIAEGYSTAAQLAEALGHATVAAFDAGNLEAVAKALHDRYPDTPIVIAGDDDRHLVMTHGANRGRDKAEAAAQAVGGRAIFPTFAPSDNAYPKELPPITPQSYRAHLHAEEQLACAVERSLTLSPEETAKLKAALLTKDQLSALNRMKQHTDFNDVALSNLGPEAVKRQLSATAERLPRDRERQRSAPRKQALGHRLKVDRPPRRTARMGG